MKVYVGNLSKQVTDEQLNDLALPFGKPDTSHIAKELGGASKGFGFVEYADPITARAVIAGLNGKDVNGQVLKVREANVTRVVPAEVPTP